MKAQDLRELTSEELATKAKELEAEIFNLRFQHATGQLENTMRLREVRRDIARVKTMLREKRA